MIPTDKQRRTQTCYRSGEHKLAHWIVDVRKMVTKEYGKRKTHPENQVVPFI